MPIGAGFCVVLFSTRLGSSRGLEIVELHHVSFAARAYGAACSVQFSSDSDEIAVSTMPPKQPVAKDPKRLASRADRSDRVHFHLRFSPASALPQFNREERFGQMAATTRELVRRIQNRVTYAYQEIIVRCEMNEIPMSEFRRIAMKVALKAETVVDFPIEASRHRSLSGLSKLPKAMAIESRLEPGSSDNLRGS